VLKGARALPSLIKGTATEAERSAVITAGARVGAGAVIGAGTPVITEGRAPTMRDVAAGIAFVGLYGEPRWKAGVVKLPESLKESQADPEVHLPQRMAGSPIIEGEPSETTEPLAKEQLAG